MADDKDRERDIENDQAGGDAKRSGRESVDPANQPGEFADDMATNRFTPPPPPMGGRDHSH